MRRSDWNAGVDRPEWEWETYYRRYMKIIGMRYSKEVRDLLNEIYKDMSEKNGRYMVADPDWMEELTHTQTYVAFELAQKGFDIESK